jgi:ribosomal protein S18 acetylase RimI-like enzyme
MRRVRAPPNRPAIRQAAARAFPTIDVVTQGSNVAAVRAYEAAGFRLSRSEVWLHRWADEQRAPR